jgi:hypothetical protein
MIELVLLIAVVAAVVLAIRGSGGADEPVIVRRPGQYHITLAPQLDSERSFLESVAKLLADGNHPAGDAPTRYFRMGRAGVQEEDFYLLAVAFRKGVFFIQAIMPRPLVRDAASHLAALREFSDAVLLHYPPVPPLDEEGAGRIDAAVEEVARQAGVVVVRLGV